MSVKIGDRIVMIVAQQSFEFAGTHTTNTFCTLAPVLTIDGVELDPEEFPNCGLVWWMVTTQAEPMASAGTPVVGTLELAKKFEHSDPNAMQYQVDLRSVQLVSPDIGYEVLNLTSSQLKNPLDLIDPSEEIRVTYRPTKVVFVRLGHKVYGPFDCLAQHAGGRYTLKLSPQMERKVYEIPLEEFRNVAGASLVKLSREISLEGKNRADASLRDQREFEFVGASVMDALRSGSFPMRTLLSDREVVAQLAKRVLTRRQKQEFAAQLEDLSGRVSGDEAAAERDALERLRRGMVQDIEHADQLARALVDSGVIDAKISDEIDRRVREEIDSRAASLKADLTERHAELSAAVEALERRREKLDDELSAVKQRRLDQLDLEIKQRLGEAMEDVERQKRAVEQQKEDLEHQRTAVSLTLEDLSARFRDDRASVVKEFLALLPLLEKVGMAPNNVVSQLPSSPDPERPKPDIEGIVAWAALPARTESVDEEEFFERFKNLVKETGLAYREADLVSFHVATKTADITILGGFSGTGKSSLAQAYARAVCGAEDPDDERFLPVWVSPSWLDSKDLLGHANALTQDFQFSDTGLFEFLVRAQEEEQCAGADAGIALVLLDEMNLAQVEHYFAAFLQALPSRERSIRCFEERAVASDSPLRRYSIVRLSRSLRFVGTVNFDETTRQLSLRLLDRANLIDIQPAELAEVSVSGRVETPTAKGPSIRQRDFEAWTHERPLSKELAPMLDRLRKPLADLGCPLTPRRYRGVCRFVSSSTKLCAERDAFDLQVAQRIIPQLRGVFGPQAASALAAMRAELERADLERSLSTLESLVRVDIGSDSFEDSVTGEF